jgi:hypothetical protein
LQVDTISGGLGIPSSNIKRSRSLIRKGFSSKFELVHQVQTINRKQYQILRLPSSHFVVVLLLLQAIQQESQAAGGQCQKRGRVRHLVIREII